MLDEVYEWSVQEKLIEPGDFVLAGVSGGADSVCLLRLLLDFREKMDFTLEAVHVEHGIRGAESRQDAAFVEALCQKYEVSCHVCHVNVPEYAAEHGLGLEESARILRYEAYRTVAEQAAEKYGCGGRLDEELPAEDLQEAAGLRRARPRIRVALAHHADDNAETVLFQMVRGSGIRGLCGMQPVRAMTDNIAVIRPLLLTTRAGIETYLKARGQEYRTDSTNLDTDYSRNRIRHEVLPQLSQINPQAVSHITKCAGLLSELTAYMEEETAAILSAVCVDETDGCRIGMELFYRYPALLQGEVVLKALERVAGSRKDIGRVHVEAVIKLAGRQVGRSYSLPYGMRAERTYEGVYIRRKMPYAPLAADGSALGGEKECYELSQELLLRAEAGERIRLLLPDGEFCLRVLDFHGEMREIPKKAYTKWLNYDKIKCNLYLRKRAGGDYLVIDEAGHRKKLKEYFIEAKIPREQRGQIWLLTEGSHVIWAVGARIGTDYKVSENTKRVLEVQISGGNYREDQEH